jgi:hypothetical protein
VRCVMGRKERLAADPQNSFWANDTSKFGRKMLERMGWAEGQGLGADGRGTTTHVEVVRKVDNAGIGVATEQSDNWLVHNDNLNDILAMLNEQYASPSSVSASASVTVEATTTTATSTNAESDERQLSGYHRMYRKRVRNKDVSQYSSADVAQILGLQPSASSSSSSSKRKRSTTDDNDTNEDDARPMLGGNAGDAGGAGVDDVVETSAHVTSSVSVSDYFSSKMRLLSGDAPAKPATQTKRRAVEATTEATKEARKAEKKAAKKLEKKAAKKLAKKLAKKKQQKKKGALE